MFDVPGGGREIVGAVEEAVGGWREQARVAGVPGHPEAGVERGRGAAHESQA